MKRTLHMAIVAVLALGVALLGGCAGASHVDRVARGEFVALTVTETSQDASSVAIRNQAMGSDMSVGAASGGVAGGLWGLTCGPWAPLCVPLGAALGLVTGTAGGAVVGLTGALPAEKAARLRERLAQVRKSHDLLAELRGHFTDRAAVHWTLDASRAKVDVTVELGEIELNSTRDEHINLVVHAFVTVRRVDGQLPSQRKRYDHATPMGTLAAWLDDGGDLIDTSLSNASRQLAAQIVSELAAN